MDWLEPKLALQMSIEQVYKSLVPKSVVIWSFIVHLVLLNLFILLRIHHINCLDIFVVPICFGCCLNMLSLM